MLFQKGFFIRKIIKNKFIFLNLSLLVLIFCAVFIRINNENNRDEDLKVYLPIENVKTEESVYSITVNINGKEKSEDIMLLSQVLKGLKIKATFFVSPSWIDENIDLYNKLKDDDHLFGLNINNNKSLMSREDAINFLATNNDEFLNLTDTYPTFVRIENDKSGKIPKLLNAFGQKYISSSNIFETSNKQLKAGDIVFVSKISSSTPYDIAEFIGKCTSENFYNISLNELLNINTQEKVSKE